MAKLKLSGKASEYEKRQAKRLGMNIRELRASKKDYSTNESNGRGNATVKGKPAAKKATAKTKSSGGDGG